MARLAACRDACVLTHVIPVSARQLWFGPMPNPGNPWVESAFLQPPRRKPYYSHLGELCRHGTDSVRSRRAREPARRGAGFRLRLRICYWLTLLVARASHSQATAGNRYYAFAPRWTSFLSDLLHSPSCSRPGMPGSGRKRDQFCRAGALDCDQWRSRLWKEKRHTAGQEPDTTSESWWTAIF